jgi:predicted transcriptional regulator
MVKRGKLEIMRDILNIVKDNKNSIKPTPLLRKSGLSSASFNEYYSEIIQKKLLEEQIDQNGNKKVNITNQGHKFIERYRSIIEFIEEFDL